MNPLNVRTWDDEAIDEAAQREIDGVVTAEMARRAEIRLNRMVDVEYGDNRYGFTLDGIREMHDASWYESRQTEAQFLAEMHFINGEIEGLGDD